MIMKRLIYVLCCLLAVFTSCTKDNEDDAPKVGIYSMEDLIAFGDAVNSGQDLSQWKDVNNQSVLLYDEQRTQGRGVVLSGWYEDRT